MCDYIFFTIFVWNVCHSRKKCARYWNKFAYVFMWNACYSCQNLTRVAFSRQIIEKYSNVNFFLFYYDHSKKVQCTLVQALRLCTGRTTNRGSRGIALFFLDYGTRRGWRVSRSGEVRKISSLPEFDPRTVHAVASRYTDWATEPTWPQYIIKIRYLNKKSNKNDYTKKY